MRVKRSNGWLAVTNASRITSRRIAVEKSTELPGGTPVGVSNPVLNR